MNDDWLWTGAPPEDPDDARIATALGTLARDRTCPELPDRAPAGDRAVERVVANAPIVATNVRTRRLVATALALAAGLVLAAGLAGDRWEVRAITGPRPCLLGPCGLREGASLTTSPASEWEMALPNVGTVRVHGGTSLARLATTDGHLLRLDAGAIDVAVHAPPRNVRVETPAALVVDLGCAYALAATSDATRLVVTDGSVALENDAGISIVTAGSVATARVGHRPELPLRADAPEALAAAVHTLEARLDAGSLADDALADALAAPARAQDLLTLWHALQLVPEGPRARLLDAMLARAPGIAVDPAAVMRLDDLALTALWQALVPYALREPAIAGPW